MALAPNPARVEQFYQAYVPELVKSVQKAPDTYLWPVEQAPEVARKMVNSLALGTASLSAASKRAAKLVGAKPTIKGIRDWLTALQED